MMIPRTHAPCLGVTLGDPAGVGPELILRLLAEPAVRASARLVVYGSADILREVSRNSGIPWPEPLVLAAADDPQGIPQGTANVLLDTPVTETVRPGEAQAPCGRLACDWIAAAVRDVRRGVTGAIVTAPICKAALQAAAIPYPGHTEMLADLTGTGEVRMFFWSSALAVGLVTIHLPLSAVRARLTPERVLETIRLVADAVRNSDAPQPRIGVLGFNPHAGEGGIFGDAEQTAIGPAIATARAEGIDAVGPLVPDTAFRDAPRRTFDAFVAMYHDQGLIPFKMLAFDEGVNVTLGLPFCRTSPDHGTAFDIAWQGKASPASLLAAVRYARDRVLA
jgi:4-hydroxythreonine-4-phosphate dehydrogenase